ncbi:MAG: hypothetical protein E4H23_01475 [Chrysiogenales bacterium]|nr:MAG: hypothetical protein E4H23_01475 [Chrysiogenales bacterium]
MNKRKKTGRVLVWIGLALSMTAASFAQTSPRESKILESFSLEENIRGLAASGSLLWSIDSERGVLLQVSKQKRAVLKRLKIETPRLRTLTGDGKVLWGSGEDPRKLFCLDAANGKIIRILEIRAEKTAGVESLEALAWDGKSLWAGYSAGWSSRILRIDPESGVIKGSFYSEGIPRGLTADGTYLWMATYNEGKYPSLLARWTIQDDSGKMSLSHRFIVRLPGKNPVGLAREGKAFWYADQDKKTIVKIRVPEEN